MLQSFVEKIITLAKPNITEKNGLTYSDKTLSVVCEPLPQTLQLSTLSSLITYVEQNIDKQENMFVVVEKPNKVSVYTELSKTQERKRLLQINPSVCSFTFNQYYGIDSFIIALQTQFIKTNNLDQLLSFVSSISSDKGSLQEDDGFSQKVTTKRGVSMIGASKIPNPVELSPCRVFPEVTQPILNFVLRARQEGDEVKLALFDTNGDLWKMEATKNIKQYLIENLPAKTVVLA